MFFWSAVFYLSAGALVLFGASLAYILRKRIRKADRIRAALAQEKAIEHGANPGPDPDAGTQTGYSALKTVDAQTGKVTYEMHPVSQTRTEVGTFAYVVGLLSIAALLPVYGLPAGIAVLVLAPLAARKFMPSLERAVGFRLILFAVIAAGAGALASLLSSLGYFHGAAAPAAGAAAPLGQLAKIPIYVPFSLLGVLIFSVVMHESAHGLVAYWCGDSTAKRAGRLTLNPLKHFDLFGSFILPALLFFTTGIALGYAKPVPINMSRFGRQRRDRIFASTAGVATNFMLAAISLSLLVAVAFVISAAWPGAQVSGFSGFLHAPVMRGIPAAWLWAVLVQVLKSFFVVNLVLGVANMIPVPPLDGSYVLESVLPRSLRLYFRLLRLFGFVIIIIVLAVLMFTGVFGRLIALVEGTSGLIRFVTHLN